MLLASDEPAPVLEHNNPGPSPFFLTCDHYGQLVPRALGDLGVCGERMGAAYRLGHRHRRRDDAAVARAVART